MDARENRPLHAALMLLVLVTITLGLTAYSLFRQNEEASRRAAADRAARMTAQQALSQAVQEVQTLQHIVSGGGDISPGDIEAIRSRLSRESQAVLERFEQDMRELAGSSETTKAYAPGQRFLTQALQITQSRLVDAIQRDEEAEKDQERNLARERDRHALADAEVARLHTRTEQVLADSATRAERSNESLARVHKTLDETYEQFAAHKAESRAKEERLRKDLLVANSRVSLLERELVRLRRPELEAPDGYVAHVNQRLKTVWLSLRGSETPRSGFVFHVFEAGQTSFDKAKPKGRVEVVRRTDSGLVEARIAEDVLRNPILGDDLISSPEWPPK